MMNSNKFSLYEDLLNTFNDNFFQKIKISDSNKKIIYNLYNKGIIKIERENFAYIDYFNSSNRYFKNFIDSVNFEEIDCNLKEEILYLKRYILNLNKNKINAIFLIGSVSRNKFEENSDIDIVLIHSGEKIELPKIFYNRKVQFIKFNNKNILKDIDENEVLVWTLKYGLLIYDKNYVYNKLVHNPLKINFQKLIFEKRLQIEKTFALIDNLLRKDSLKENKLLEDLFKVNHLIKRYIVLCKNDIPKSRPELQNQIKKNNIILDIELNKFPSHDEIINFYFSLKNFYINFTLNNQYATQLSLS